MRALCRQSRVRTLRHLAALGLLGVWSVGCAAPNRPCVCFAQRHDEIAADWDRMEEAPLALERPVVILSGWRAPALTGVGLAGRLKRLTGGRAEDFLVVSYPFAGTMDAAVSEVVRRVEARWRSPSPGETVEVDVVAISMGGLVARAAAADGVAPADGGPCRKRLRIARLFTLASPHRGAKLAQTIALDAAARDMTPGSAFLTRLDRALEGADYEMVCYAQLNDTWVGATRAAPPGCNALWTEGPPALSHFSIADNRRITADIARRLRGETPLAEPGGPPPRD